MPQNPQPWRKLETRSLACYVWPAQTAEWMGLSQRGDEDTFHDLRRNSPRELVEGLYHRLASMRLPYEAAEIHFAAHHPQQQAIRIPPQIARLGGNCLDLSLLTAAVCETVLLRPLVVLLQGHALLAIWLGGDLTDVMASGRPGPKDYRLLSQGVAADDRAAARSALLELAKDGEYLLLDCTGFARSQVHGPTEQLSFDDAVALATRRVTELELFDIADIAFLHHHQSGYQPYPDVFTPSERQSSVELGELGIRRIREALDAHSVSIALPQKWTNVALEDLRIEVQHLPSHVCMAITHVLTGLRNALEAVEVARIVVPQALSEPLMRRALTGMRPGAPLPTATEDVDFFSHVALHSPIDRSDSRQHLAAYLLHLADVAEVDAQTVLPWARSTGYAHANEVHDTLQERRRASRLRLIISLHASSVGMWTQQPQAWLLDGRDLLHGPMILQCAPTQEANELALSHLLVWGHRMARKLDLPLRHVDVVPPARQALTWRPELALSHLLDVHDPVTRWSYRLNPPAHRIGGLFRALQRLVNIQEGHPEAPVDWLDADDVAHSDFPHRLQNEFERAIGLKFEPKGHQTLVEDLLEYAPALLWPDEGCEVNPQICQALADNWSTLPRSFALAYRSKRKTKAAGTIADLRSLWDDQEWLDFCLLYA